MTIKLNARARQNIEEWIEAWAKLGGHRQDAADLTMLLKAHDAAARLEAERDAALAKVAEMEKQVYVPGLWRCPKCKFSLLQRNLNAADGTVTARDEPGDKCPNCAGPLWRVSERDERQEAQRFNETLFDRATAAEAKTKAIVADLGDSISRAVTTDAREDAEVRALCERVGYGAVMDAASRLWIRKDPLGAFVVGPCAGTVRALLAKTGGN